MAPCNARTLNDLAPNGWDEFRLHELTQVMRQNDLTFVTALHKIHINQPANGSPEDNLLRSCELSCVPGDMSYPYDAMHVYAQNMYCDEWNEYMLGDWQEIQKHVLQSIARKIQLQIWQVYISQTSHMIQVICDTHCA